MNLQDQVNQLTQQLQQANKRISDLERISIQPVIDPTTFLYLKSAVLSITGQSFTSTFSGSAPSGTAVTGSIWFQDAALLSDRKIFVYTGSSWQQMK